MMLRLATALATALLLCALLVGTPALAQISDVEAPQLISIAFTPTSIDVRTVSQSVLVAAQISDNLSGATHAYIYFYSPTRRQYTTAYLSRVSGTAMMGLYQGNANFQTGIDSGAWLLEQVYLYDTAGNQRSLNGAALQAIQPARTLTVVSIPDATKPIITGLRISPRSIDVSSGDQTVTIEFDFTDDVVGMSPSGTSYTFSPVLRSPTGRQYHRGSGNNWTVLPSGTAIRATWQKQFVIPRLSEAGQWSIETITQYDRNNSYWRWTTSDLSALGLDPYFQVISNTQDLTPPTVADVSVAPGFVNTTLSSQQVTIALRVADTGSGVIFAPDSVGVSWVYGPYYRSPSQQQYSFVSPFNGYKLAGGSTLNGVWQGSFVLPRYAEAGTWNIQELRVRDRAHNQLYLNRTQLESMGLQRTIVVTQPTGTADNVINGGTGGTVADDVFGARAQVSVPPNVLTGQTTVSIDVFQNPLQVPNPMGFLAPGTHFVNISLSPKPAGLLPPPGLTVTLPVPGNLTPGTVLTLFRVDPATGTLVQARSVTGGPVRGSVDPGGQSATFTGIAALSTLVALIPSGTVVGDANLDSVVDCLDYATVRQAFGKRRGQVGFLASADLNNDGLVSINDLMIVARQLTVGCPAS